MVIDRHMCLPVGFSLQASVGMAFVFSFGAFFCVPSREGESGGCQFAGDGKTVKKRKTVKDNDGDRRVKMELWR